MSLPLFQELMKVLSEEAGCYRQLSDLARRQKEILVAAQMEDLPVNLRHEEKQVFLLGPLVAKRNELLGKIAQAAGAKKMDLSQAILAAPGEVAEAFQETALGLAQAARELEALNQGNEKLLKNALSYVNFTLKAIASGGRPSAAQMKAGYEKPAASFVNRTV
ncbi:MAG TPA: flagellar protein FlgN [bacterium]|nr:flagellar protein FlgN [bacterium]